MATINVTELRSGTAFLIDGKPYQVVKYTHQKIARGGGNVKLEVRNLKTGGLEEKTFNSSAKVEKISTIKRPLQYLYKSSGAAVLGGPTTGYLVGFIFASWMVGAVAYRQKTLSLGRILVRMLAGALLIDVLGSIWLKLLFNLNLSKMLWLGFWPFLPGDIMKLIVASLVYQRIQARAKQIFGR